MASNVGNRAGSGTAAASIVVSLAAMLAAVAAGAAGAAAAGLVAILATSAAVVGGGGLTGNGERPEKQLGLSSAVSLWQPASRITSFDATVLRPSALLIGHHSRAVTSQTATLSTSSQAEEHEVSDISKRRVQFDLSRVTVHEVTPYSEVYGEHPKRLSIGSVDEEGNLTLQKTKSRRVAEDCDSDEDDEDDLTSCRAGRILSSVLKKALPKARWASWTLILISVFLLQAFGAHTVSAMISWPLGSEFTDA